MSFENLKLLIASYLLSIAIVLALGALIIAIIFEVQCRRYERKKEKGLTFSDDVNDKLSYGVKLS